MTVSEFFAANSFSTGTECETQMLADFLREMDAGLAGDPESSLRMIPSYISPGKALPLNTPVPVLDAGGTNLRAAIVQFDASGKAIISNFSKTCMPGTQGYVDNETFYTALADVLEPVIEPGQTFGFCFSYSADVTPESDARLYRWSKNIEAPGIEGRLVGSDLSACLAARGIPGTRAVVLNDTVATLLAASSEDVSDCIACVGFILGTGTNTAYYECIADIPKLSGVEPVGRMAVNCESGAFACVPQSAFDRETDSFTIDPGRYLLEKTMAGGHMGALGTVILRRAAEAGLFSEAAAKAVLAHELYTNIVLDSFCAEPSAEALFDGAGTPADIDTALELIRPIYIRAAHFAAINMSAAVIHAARATGKKGCVCINVDGSTFHKTKAIPFRATVEAHMKRLLAPHGLTYRIIHVDDAPMLGAAVAALTR